MTDEPSDISGVGEHPSSPDKALKVVNRPGPDDLAQLGASDLYRSQLVASEQMKALAGGSAAEPMRKMMGGSLADQMRKAVGGSLAEQMRRAVGGSLAERMRVAEQAFRPPDSVQERFGDLARSAAEGPLRQLLDQQDSWRRQMSELSRPKWDQSLVGSALAESLRAIQSFGNAHQAKFLRYQGAIRQQLDSVSHLIEALRPKLPSFEQISEFWLRYPARLKDNLIALATAGWYLDPEMAVTDIVHFKEDLQNNTAEEVNDELAEHFRSSLDRIEASLCENHPARAPLLRDAFAAHRDGKFSLSIPALFAQADGICFDLTGYKIFANNGIYRLAKRIDPDTMERAYLEPLLRSIPIKETSKQRRAKIPQLNRHAVMHGESIDFPTEENGLKAISFINFVSYVLAMAVAFNNEMAVLADEQEAPLVAKGE